MDMHRLVSNLRIMLALAFAGFGNHPTLIHPDCPKRVAGKPTKGGRVWKAT